MDGTIREAPQDWFKNLFARRRIDATSACEYLSQSAFYKAGRWMLPEPPERVFSRSEPEGPPDGDVDSQIQHRFMDIFNDVLDYFGFRSTRKVVATQSTDDEWDDNNFDYNQCYMNTPRFSTRPDMVLVGQDARLCPRDVDTYTRAMSVDAEERRDLYRGCVAIGKVQRFTRWNDMDMMLEKVATCARCAFLPPSSSVADKYHRECFLHQPGRRFVYSFSLTPEDLQLFLFDRNGVVKSKSLNIHKSAVQFVQAIQILAGANLANMGFDPAIYWENGVQCVDVVNRVGGTVKYEINDVISQKTTISGSGTLCWGLREVEGRDFFVMKDMWRRREDGREEEFLSAIEQAGISGVSKLLLVDHTHGSRPLSISSLRHGQGFTSEVPEDRIFSRLLFEADGPSICHFKSGLKFLQAMRAAIESECRVLGACVYANVHPSPSLSREGWLSPPGHFSVTHPARQSGRSPIGRLG